MPYPPPQSRADIAKILGVSEGYLKFLLRTGLRYKIFWLSKKKGGTREIAAPSDALKQLQRRLLPYLERLYGGRYSVHGFAVGKSIRSNAERHVKARYVLNVDLENFFPTIHFGRIRGMLRGKPYFFGREAANIVANLCCRTSLLPQGAPTSPVLSNMISAKLDSDLKAIAKRYFTTYTRYADDITFSTNSQSFPRALARFAEETGGKLQVGDELQKLIEQNGFRINAAKLRLSTRHERQEVTGLTINRFTNVQRRFVRQVRAMLHAWKKYGLAKAQEEFSSKFDHRNRRGKQPCFANVVRGKVEFIGSVRGHTNPLYWRLLRQYADLHIRDIDKSYQLREPDEFIEYDSQELKRALWVLIDKTTNLQSTAFFLKDVGLVTCDHAIGDPDSLFIFASSDPLETHFQVTVATRDQRLDLAILKAPSVSAPKFLLAGDDDLIRQRDPIRLLGFPQHHSGAEASIYEGYLVHQYKFEGVRRFHISAPIMKGNSGGPVLNSENRVVGIAIKGGDEDQLNGVVPIRYLFELAVANQRSEALLKRRNI